MKTDQDDNTEIHPLDIDYTDVEDKPERRLQWSVVPAINLGIVCFALAALMMVIAIITSQLGGMSAASMEQAYLFRRLGSLLILAGGLFILHGVRSNSDVHVERRKRAKEKKEEAARNKALVRFQIGGKDPEKAIDLQDWIYALKKFPFLVPKQDATSGMPSEFEDVNVVWKDTIVAVLRWDLSVPGRIHVVTRLRYLETLKIPFEMLLAELGAESDLANCTDGDLVD